MRSLVFLVAVAATGGCDDREGDYRPPDASTPDEDGDGYPSSEDCDDRNPDISPGAEERCDNIDNDCDGDIDEGLAETWYPDADGDGFGSDAESTEACVRPEGHVPNADDCNDDSAVTFPGADEYCDGIDNDCDGEPDPTLCRPLATAEVRLDGQGAGHKLGHAVARLGDLDGDGYAEIAVGAPAADPQGYRGGAVWFFSGPLDSDAGLSGATARFDGRSLDDQAGWAVSAAGDLNGDGVGDALVGAWGDDAAGSESGAVYALLGPLSGVLTPADATATYRGLAVGDSAGEVLAGGGDHNGDGLADLVVGARNADGAGFSSGAAYLVYGGTTGVQSLGRAAVQFLGSAEGDQLGAAVVQAGDLDGDGRPDLALSAPGSSLGLPTAGAIHVFLHTPEGEVTAADEADVVLIGGAEGDQAGAALAAAGDVDRDGYSDFVVGAPDQQEGGRGAGAAYLLRGPLTGSGSLRDAHARMIGRLPGDHAGNSVSTADFNGDGETDFLVGAYIEDSGALNAGAVFLVHGPLTGTLYLSEADAGFLGEAESDLAGWSATAAGDVDNDGLEDILVGAPNHDRNGDNAGAAYLLYAAGL